MQDETDDGSVGEVDRADDVDGAAEAVAAKERRGLRLRWGHVVVLVVVTAMLTAGGTAWASHKFADVPDSNPFHNDISWLAGTGITTGYADGGYHPNDPVTRQAMAAFMKRLYNLQAGLTASAYVSSPTSPTVNKTWTDTGVSATVTIPPGAQGRILVTSTTQLGCNNGDNIAVIFAVAAPYCHLRVLDNGSTAKLSPDDWIVQSSPDAKDDGDIKADFEAVTIQARSDAVWGAGQHTITLQAKLEDSESSDANNHLDMYVGPTVLAVQVALVDA